MLACRKASTLILCTSSANPLGAAPGQQIGGDQGGIVAALLADAGDQRVGSRIGESVEPALQRGGGPGSRCPQTNQSAALAGWFGQTSGMRPDETDGLPHDAPLQTTPGTRMAP